MTSLPRGAVSSSELPTFRSCLSANSFGTATPVVPRPESTASEPSAHLSVITSPAVSGSMPVTVVLPVSPTTRPVAKRIRETAVTPSTCSIGFVMSAGSGEKPSSWVTMLTALTCSSMPWSIVARRPAAKIATSTTSATPIISADAVTAVRCGWRRLFSRASMPVRPWKRASGRPIRPLSGRTSVGASSAKPKIISSVPKPSTVAVALAAPGSPSSP